MNYKDALNKKHEVKINVSDILPLNLQLFQNLQDKKKKTDMEFGRKYFHFVFFVYSLPRYMMELL